MPSCFTLTDDETSKRILGLYHYTIQKEVLHELAGEAEAKLCSYAKKTGISLDNENLIVRLHREIMRLMQDVLTEEYNDQQKIDEAKAFIINTRNLFDSAWIP
jgi:hypothetical protein